MYSTTPTDVQKDLLAATITIRYPERIQTVGESIQYLLQRGGYRLAEPEVAGFDIEAWFVLPLPAIHRGPGPVRLRQALQAPAGSALHLVQDPGHRLITFGACASAWFATLAANANVQSEAARGWRAPSSAFAIQKTCKEASWEARLGVPKGQGRSIYR